MSSRRDEAIPMEDGEVPGVHRTTLQAHTLVMI